MHLHGLPVCCLPIVPTERNLLLTKLSTYELSLRDKAPDYFSHYFLFCRNICLVEKYKGKNGVP
jgi:hypothetical protein